MSVSTPWFVDAFTNSYLEVYGHRDETSARREVQGALNLLRHDGSQGRLLDLCSGAGRHSRAFRLAGCPVTCFDLSPDLVRQSAELGLPTVRGDMRALPFAGGSHAAVACLFSSFGYFDTDAEHQRTLCEIARVLAPGGRALLDLMDRDTVRAQLRPQSVEVMEGRTIEVERALTDDGTRVEKAVRLRRSGAPTQLWQESVRLFTADELQLLANGAGLIVERTCGDFEGRPHVPGQTRRLLLLRKPLIPAGTDLPPSACDATPGAAAGAARTAPAAPPAPRPGF
ncbi:MAG TPA: class I SAM-dependent methyltransferase [Planctomycetota bacterium]|nr:class I SAM-dependent methyltransferase [Planctomycetota bacterium]